VDRPGRRSGRGVRFTMMAIVNRMRTGNRVGARLPDLTHDLKGEGRMSDKHSINTMAERFWSKVQKAGPDECWLWLASTWGGYGQLSVNMRRGKYATKTHCKHGHEFTEENTYHARPEWRHCRECFRIRQRTPEVKEYQRQYRLRKKIEKRGSNGDND